MNERFMRSMIVACFALGGLVSPVSACVGPEVIIIPLGLLLAAAFATGALCLNSAPSGSAGRWLGGTLTWISIPGPLVLAAITLDMSSNGHRIWHCHFADDPVSQIGFHVILPAILALAASGVLTPRGFSRIYASPGIWIVWGFWSAGIATWIAAYLTIHQHFIAFDYAPRMIHYGFIGLLMISVASLPQIATKAKTLSIQLVIAAAFPLALAILFALVIRSVDFFHLTKYVTG